MLDARGGGGGKQSATRPGDEVYDKYGNVIPTKYEYTYQDPVTNDIYGWTGSQWVLWRKGTATAAAQPSGGGGGRGGGGGGGGGGSAGPSLSSVNSVAEIYRLWMGDAWVAANKSVINNAAANSWTERMIIKDAAQRGANTPYAASVVNYIRSVCGPLPLETVYNIIGSGVWQEPDFETRIAPQYSTDVMTNPQSLPFVQLWNQYTAAANFGPTAQSKLKEIVTRFGYTDAALAQWEQWLTTTHSAKAGNYGAEKRGVISSYITGWLGREPTEQELSPDGPYWDMVGGLMGDYNTAAFKEAIRATEEYQVIFGPKLASQSEEDYLAWRDSINSVGDWYFNDRPGVAGEPYVNNFLGFTNEELTRLNSDGWTASELRYYYQAVEEAAYNQGVYGPLVQEAFGSDAGIDWFVLANGGKGSGEMRAKLVEAQNRVQFREAYRQVFGTDPSPADYDRITEQFISPSELIREHQAIESADEMYKEVSELLQRVYGETVTKAELKDMVLGRPDSGELKALIAEATKLDQYTWIHKKYYGTVPTPSDYAKYAGYTGPAELQWEIVTAEKVAEMKPLITEAWEKTYPDQPMISDTELYTLYGEQEGYGEIAAKVREAMQKADEMEQSELYQYSGAEHVDISYRMSEQGGFRTTFTPLADIEQ